MHKNILNKDYTRTPTQNQHKPKTTKPRQHTSFDGFWAGDLLVVVLVVVVVVARDRARARHRVDANRRFFRLHNDTT